MRNELLMKQLSRHLSGIPDKKAFQVMRKERNVLGCYKIIGNYYKTRQKTELGDEQHVSSQGV